MSRGVGVNPPVRGKVRRPGPRRPAPPSQPLTCTHTADRDGERIFAIEGGNMSTGGMPESELRGLVAVFEATPGLAADLRPALTIIKAALDG